MCEVHPSKYKINEDNLIIFKLLEDLIQDISTIVFTAINLQIKLSEY